MLLRAGERVTQSGRAGSPRQVLLDAVHGAKVFRERIYVGEPWEAPALRAQWVERMG